MKGRAQMNASTQIKSQQDDFATLTKAKAKVEALRVWAAVELDRAMFGSIANDVLESLHHELENRAASIGCALGELEDELGATDENEEHRRDYYSNLGVGRTAA